MLKKIRLTKIFVCLNKKHLGTVKVGGTYLTVDEFAILMRHVKCHFKNWTLPKTLIVALLKEVKTQFSQEENICFIKD